MKRNTRQQKRKLAEDLTGFIPDISSEADQVEVLALSAKTENEPGWKNIDTHRNKESSIGFVAR